MTFLAGLLIGAWIALVAWLVLSNCTTTRETTRGPRPGSNARQRRDER